MLQPKRTKFRKFQKGHTKGVKVNTLSFGSFGVQILASGHLSASVIEASRRSITRKLKRQGQVWVRVFPYKTTSKKPAEIRMGKGKGSPELWVCPVQQGQIIFEFDSLYQIFQLFLLYIFYY